MIDPATNLLSLNTNNLHVELVAPDTKIILSRILRIEGGLGNGDFNIPDSIPSGDYRVRAYTNHMRNFDDEFFFLKEINITGKVYSSSGDLITTFKSTNLGMGFFDIKPIHGLTYYAVADARYSEDASSFPSSISSWFLLESDVHGPVEEPARYFDLSNNSRFEELDLLLLTQGWRDFEWKYDSLNSFGNEVGFTISVKLKKALSDKPNGGVKINMGLFANKAARFFTAQTDSLGRFEIKDLDITGKVDAFITATSKMEGNKGRLFLDSVRYIPPAVTEMKSEKANILPSNYSLFQQEAAVRFDIKKKYKLSDTLNIGEVIITAKKPETQDEIKIKESRRVYGLPDKELVITPVMEKYPGDVFSFLSGRIGGVRQIIGSGGETVGISVRGKGMALILMDGAEVNPDSYIIVTTLPIYMIDRIDVLEASPLYGMRGANGVVNIITRKGMRRSPAELTPNTAAVKINGFDAPRIFYSPKYDDTSAKTYLPDTRTTIFWEPNISIREHRNAMMNYFNADDPAIISILVEGITKEGIPVTGRAIYEVK